jgi:hypothetical protein
MTLQNKINDIFMRLPFTTLSVTRRPLRQFIPDKFGKDLERRARDLIEVTFRYLRAET